MVKSIISGIVGFFAASISYLLGGMDNPINALLIFMAIDFITGMLNAIVFKKSKKTKHGRASSAQGIKGITKKLFMLLVVAMAVQLDIVLKTSFIRDGVVIGYASMEGISIIENIVLAGVPVPKVIKNALEILNKNSKDKGDDSK